MEGGGKGVLTFIIYYCNDLSLVCMMFGKH